MMASCYLVAMAYNLRNHKRINYRAIENPMYVTKSSSNQNTKSQRLYETVEEDDYTGRVKVHYIGYNSEYDERKNKEDMVVI